MPPVASSASRRTIRAAPEAQSDAARVVAVPIGHGIATEGSALREAVGQPEEVEEVEAEGRERSGSRSVASRRHFATCSRPRRLSGAAGEQFEHRTEGVALDDRVRIQQQHEVAAREGKGAIVRLGESEVCSVLEDADLRVVLANPFRRPVGAAVVAQNDFGVEAFERGWKRLAGSRAARGRC